MQGSGIGRVPRLRRRNMRIGLAASGALLVANVGYLVATLDRPNRVPLLALQALAIAVGILVVATPRNGIGTWLRRRISTLGAMLLWAASQTAIILAAMVLDGGLSSPMTLLLFVPLLIGALTFTPGTVAIHVSGNVVGVVGVGVVTGTLDIGTAALLPVVLASTAAVATTAGRSLWVLTSQLDRANAELAELARTDPLTGCLNHRSFHEALGAALEDRRGAGDRGAEVAVLLLDVDHFKRINDRYGHPTGDEVLVAIAEAVGNAIRDGDLLGRTGGEEFAVLLPATDRGAATEVGERIRTAFASLVDLPEPMTVSVGVAVGRGAEVSPVALLRAADRAMYDAKDAGRDRVLVAGHGHGKVSPAAV
jgi:diguanylate cyclase (GGDEF)-like protein